MHFISAQRLSHFHQHRPRQIWGSLCCLSVENLFLLSHVIYNFTSTLKYHHAFSAAIKASPTVTKICNQFFFGSVGLKFSLRRYYFDSVRLSHYKFPNQNFKIQVKKGLKNSDCISTISISIELES